MIVTQDIKLNINQSTNFTYVSAKQADANSRFLKITFCDNQNELTVPAGVIVTLRALKPDGTSCSVSGTRNDDGTVTVELTDQVLAVEGLVKADVSISQNGQILSSATFMIRVGAVPIGTEIVSENEFLQLTELYEEISELFPVDTNNLVDGSVTEAKCGDNVFCFRGEISTLGYASPNQCKKAGYYRFGDEDIATFELPADITRGGLICVYPHTSGTRWQLLYTQEVQYIRYNADNLPGAWRYLQSTDTTFSVTGKAADAKAIGDKALVYRGSIISDYGVTDANDCVSAGFYRWTTADVEHIDNLPAEVTTGGLLITYRMGNDALNWQCAFATGKMFIRYNTYSWYAIGGGGGSQGINARIIWNGTGDGNDSSVDRIMIYYYPTAELINEGRITYSIYRSQYSNVDCDVWRLGYVYKYINNVATRLTRQSEWECAMTTNGDGNYIGGYIHGHEKNPTIKVFLDGKEVEQTDIASATEFTVARIVSTSEIYNVNNVKICDHGKEWKFENGIMTVSQSLKFATDCTVNNCFLTMLPPLKTYSEHFYHNADFATYDFEDIGADYTINLPGMRECVTWCDDAWFRAGYNYYPDVTARVPYVTDHDSTYNKFYIPACDNTAVHSGDVWISQTYYEAK